jgi:hypothetical protein
METSPETGTAIAETAPETAPEIPLKAIQLPLKI